MRKDDPASSGHRMMLEEALFQTRLRGPAWAVSVLRPTGKAKLADLTLPQLSAICQAFGGVAQPMFGVHPR